MGGTGVDGDRGRGEIERPGGSRGSSLEPPAGPLLASVLDRMAHQIKNPLQAVTVNLEVVRMRVRKRAPEVWPDVERFARAVDANARLLHRRLELALAMARRTPDDPLEPRDLRGVVDDLLGALRMGEEAPEVTVVGMGRGGAGVEARTGYLVELLVRLLDAAREAAVGEAVEIRLTTGENDRTVVLELPAGGAEGPRADWVELAEAAGGELVRSEGGDGAAWRLELPGA